MVDLSNSTSFANPIPVTSPSITAMLRGYDQATDEISKAAASLNVLCATYDAQMGCFTPPDRDVYLALSAVLDMVDTVKAALELAYSNKPV